MIRNLSQEKKTTEKGLLNNEGLALMKGFQWNEHDASAISFDPEKHSLEFVVFPKMLYNSVLNGKI